MRDERRGDMETPRVLWLCCSGDFAASNRHILPFRPPPVSDPLPRKKPRGPIASRGAWRNGSGQRL
jgi:hypothetical protein